MLTLNELKELRDEISLDYSDRSGPPACKSDWNLCAAAPQICDQLIQLLEGKEKLRQLIKVMHDHNDPNAGVKVALGEILSLLNNE